MSWWKWWRGGDDNLTGSSGRDWMFGGGGDDVIDGGGGNDRLWGGRGNDTVLGGHGNDRISGGSGDDALDGGYGNDRLYGGCGDDSIHGGDGRDKIKGGSGNDYIYGDDGNDHLHGGTGRDKIKGGSGNDYIYGDDGNDRLYGNRGDDHLHGGDGRDKIKGGSGNDYIYGDDGNDRLYGERGDDYLHGGYGCDKVKGGSGNDHVDGGGGSDRVYAGRGNDYGHYVVAENVGSRDYYNGGRGNDHLFFYVTADELAAAADELEAFRAHLDAGLSGRSFRFETFDLKVKNWEDFYVVSTDPAPDTAPQDVGNSAPDAVNDTVSEGAVVIQDVEPNDPDFLNLAGTAQAIDRADFRIAATENVGDASLPRVSIEGTIEPASDVDMYAIELQAGETVILDIDFTGTPIPAPDTFLYLMDAAGNQVAFNDDSFITTGGDGSHSQFDSYLEYTVPPTAAGTYYVAVQSFFAFTGGPYTLNLSVANAADDLGRFDILADTLLANDSDLDGDALEITSVDNAINGSVELTTSGDVSFKPDSEYASSFEYTVSDGQGGESTATVTINGNSVVGTAGDDTLAGTPGNDLFTGGAGDDVFTGDDGQDAFVFAPGSGNDQVTDFTVGTDALVLTGGMTASFVEQGTDTLVNFDTGDSVLLVGVTGVTDIDDLLA